ncbi:MAG: hypothetical protein ABIB71_04205 [Candidatus Woesearchaeota archaeon]
MNKVQLIIEKEGLEGLSKKYNELDSLVETKTSLTFLEEGLTKSYFKYRLENIKKVSGLDSLLEDRMPEYLEEDLTKKFKRKKKFFSKIKGANDVCYGNLWYNYNCNENSQKFYLAAFDSLLDVMLFEHLLAIMEDKNLVKYEKPSEEIDVKLASVLKSYSKNKKFMGWRTRSKAEKVNKALCDITEEHLSSIMESCEFSDESIEGYFRELEARIVENKRDSYLSIWEDESKKLMYHLKNIAIGSTTISCILASIAVAAGYCAAVFSQPDAFSNYLAGGTAGLAIFGGIGGVGASIVLTNNVLNRNYRSCLRKNQGLIESINERSRLPTLNEYLESKT